MNDVIHIRIWRCYHLLLLLKTASESQQSILLGEKKKLSLIHEQELCRLVKLQWMWIKLGWIITFKVKQKDLQFICHCWALNAQLNCSYLEHGVFSKTIVWHQHHFQTWIMCFEDIFCFLFFCIKNGCKPQLFRGQKGS